MLRLVVIQLVQELRKPLELEPGELIPLGVQLADRVRLLVFPNVIPAPCHGMLPHRVVPGVLGVEAVVLIFQRIRLAQSGPFTRPLHGTHEREIRAMLLHKRIVCL